MAINLGIYGGGRGGTVGPRLTGRYQAEAQRQSILRATARPAAPAATAAAPAAAPGPSPEIMGMFTEAMKKYQPGGEFGKREEALLARAKKKYLASQAQRAVSAGLGGTTVPATATAKFQEEIGEPTRLGLEETRTQRLNELLMAKAGYMGGVEAREFGATQRMQELEFGAAEQMRGLRASLLTQGTGGGGGRVVSGAVDPTGRAEISPTDIGAIRARREAERMATAPPAGTEAGFRQIPKGGRIVGDYYFPPTKYTRNVPQLEL